MASPSASPVGHGFGQILGLVETSKNSDNGNTSKKKTTPVKKKSSSKFSSAASSTGEDINTLDTKWSDRFSRLEAMLLEKTFQQHSSQPGFQQVSMPVSPLKQPPNQCNGKSSCPQKLFPPGGKIF